MSDLNDAYLLLTLAGLAAMLVGGLLFTAGTTAPVAVAVLPEDAAARFLRAFWPRYYAAGAWGGTALALCLAILTPGSPLGAAYSGLLTALAGFLAACMWGAQLMIPAINAARDAGDGARFGRLHGLVLLLTGAGLVAGLVFLAALGWVLPGQYMIWMH
ncbi:MAG: DUF4149 domain-containing protein [Pseudomonadales bacterium]|nr:DUF4149 domain-containing protein [Pseudomonadales bacterium]